MSEHIRNTEPYDGPKSSETPFWSASRVIMPKTGISGSIGSPMRFWSASLFAAFFSMVFAVYRVAMSLSVEGFQMAVSTPFNIPVRSCAR